MEKIIMAKSSAAKLKANKKYNDIHTVQFNTRLNKTTDGDVIDYLETVDNKRALLLDMIRERISEQNGTAQTTITVQFESEDESGEVHFVTDTAERKVIDIVCEVYKGLPQFIKDQISVLNVAGEDNVNGMDIIEMTPWWTE